MRPVGRWFSRWKRAGGAKKGAKGRGRSAGRKAGHKSKTAHRHQPAPLTWNNPEQDFITRYGDPFDG